MYAQNVIDALVFEIYTSLNTCKEKQIDILQFVEKDLEGSHAKPEFRGICPNNEKENIIHQLHVQWSHPDSEVLNRIKLFAVRSPEYSQAYPGNQMKWAFIQINDGGRGSTLFVL